MKISIKATGLIVTPKIRSYLDDRIKKIEKLVNDPELLVKIELEKTTKHHLHGEIFRTEANVEYPKKMIRAEARGEDIFEAIDRLKDDIFRRIKRFKNKKQTKGRKGARELKKITKQL